MSKDDDLLKSLFKVGDVGELLLSGLCLWRMLLEMIVRDGSEL